MLTRRLAREPARPRVAEAGSRIGALRRRWSPVRRARYAGQRVSQVRNRSSFLVAAAFLCALSPAAAGLGQNPQPQAPPQTQEAEPSPPVSAGPSERGVAAEPERPLPADAGPAVRHLLLVELALLAIVLVGLPAFGWWIGKDRRVELRGLGLPRGSVRGMLALLLVGSSVNFLLFGSAAAGDNFSEIMAALGTLSGSVVGFYFGGRTATPPPGPNDGMDGPAAGSVAGPP